jgi:hypothetical protein
VEKNKKSCMFPRCLCLNRSMCFKIGKTFSSTKSDLQVESSSGTSKVPSVVSGDLEETVDHDTSSLDIT